MDRRAFLVALPALGLAKGAQAATRLQLFLAAAHEQTRHRVAYDSAYTRIPYPMGDVPADRGVCTDVVIRAYRAVGTDLQRLVHEDMAAHFGLYPKAWGLKRTDSNIDHRRVPNLRVFFSRFGRALPVTQVASHYSAGDLVTYTLPGNLPHIAVVSDIAGAGRPQIIHNIGAGPQQEDSLFDYAISGHYRYDV